MRLRRLSFLIPIACRSFEHKIHFGIQRRAMSGRSYKDAIDLLNTLQSNAATLEAVKASGGRDSALTIPEMAEYLERIGYKVRFLLTYKRCGSVCVPARRPQFPQCYSCHWHQGQRFYLRVRGFYSSSH